MLATIDLEAVSLIQLDDSYYPVNELECLTDTESLSLEDTIELEVSDLYSTKTQYYIVNEIDYDVDRPGYYIVYAECHVE